MTFTGIQIDETEKLRATYLDDGEFHDLFIDLTREVNSDVGVIVSQLVAMLKQKPFVAATDNCGQCSAPCCTKAVHDIIPLYQHDIERLILSDELLVNSAESFAEPATAPMGGYMHQLKMLRNLPGSNIKACIFFNMKTSRCTVYDARPDACREKRAESCEDFVPLAKVVAR